MALKRNTTPDDIDSGHSVPVNDNSGNTEAKPSWDLDAFAPYKPGDSGTSEEAAQSKQNKPNAFQKPVELEPTSFDALEDLGFGIDLQGLHAVPSTDPEAAESAAKSGVSVGTTATSNDDTSDWSKYSAVADEMSTFDSSAPKPFLTDDDDNAESVVVGPSSGDPGRLFVRLGKFSATYDIDSPSLLIGRPDPDAEVAPEVTIEWDDAISRRHARVFRSGAEDYLEDLGSTNGTKLNGETIPPKVPQLLSNGDLIHLGSQTEIAYYK